MAWRLLLLAVFVMALSGCGRVAQAQPACQSSTVPNSPACQSQAVGLQGTDIVLGQQQTGPLRPNQVVQISLQQITAGGFQGVFSSLKDTAITGLTQCVQVNSSGVFSGTGAACGSGGSGSPGGSNGQIQYNNSGSFGGTTTGAGVLSALGNTLTGTGSLVASTSPTIVSPSLDGIVALYPTATAGNAALYMNDTWTGTAATSVMNLLRATDNQVITGNGSSSVLEITQNMVSTSARGFRIPLAVTYYMSSPSANSTGQGVNYIPIVATGYTNNNDNGTSTNFGTPTGGTGSLYGLNTVAQQGPSSTYWAGTIGYEDDIEVQGPTSSATNIKIGLLIVQLGGDLGQGAWIDDAIAIQGHPQTTGQGWKNGIVFGNPQGYFPIDPTVGTMITAGPVSSGTMNALYGVDFHLVTFSGGFLRSQGFLVDGSGNLTANGATVAGTNTGSMTVVPEANASIPSAGASQVVNSITNSASGGTASNTAFVQNNIVNLTGAPNIYWWTELNQLKFNGTGGTGQHVAGYNQTLRNTYAGGGSSSNPQLWASVNEIDDFTQQPSNATNATLAMEVDLRGHNVDNALNRQGISVVIEPALDNSNAYEAANGLSVTSVAGAYTKMPVSIGGNVTTSAVELRYAALYAKGQTSLTTTTASTVASTVTSSVTIPVTNVMPFTSDIYGRDIVAGSFTNVIYFSSGGSATETGYSITGTGNTPTGTITVSSPVTLSTGTTVYNQSHTIWMATGQDIALDTTGVTTLSSNATAIIATGNLITTGTLQVGPSTNVISVDGGDLVMTIGLPIRVPGYPLASLPAVTAGNQGTLAWCNNCTGITETGSGHGVLVYQNTAGNWITPWGQAPSTTGSSFVVAGAFYPAQVSYSMLPTCNSGTRNAVYALTDANAPAYNATISSGGGTTEVLAVCNGTNWTAH